MFKPYFETPKLVLKSELTEDKLYFFSVSYLQLIKQHINFCKALYCVKWVQEVDTISLDLEKGKDLLVIWVIQLITINSKFNCQHLLEPKKMKTSSETETSCGIVQGCNFIIDNNLFIPLVTMIGRCPECVAAVNIQHMIAQKMGLAQFFAISCTECGWRINFCSSNEVTKSNNSQGRKSYEVNRRTLVAFRENGLVFNGIRTFCCFMNIPEPMAQTAYDEINSDLHNAYVTTAQESVEKAAHEICDLES